MTNNPMERRRQFQDEMERKANLVTARSRYTDNQGRISPENEQQALIDAGFKEPPPPPPEVSSELRIARLEAAERHDLTVEQADAMTSTTPDEIEAEARALAPPIPPGDGGARMPVPPLDPMAEAEKAGDWKTTMDLKAQKLINLKENR